jgi:hypothetical protein
MKVIVGTHFPHIPLPGAISGLRLFILSVLVCYSCDAVESSSAVSLDRILIPGRRVVIFKFKTHEYTYLTENWDRSPSSILWSQDSKTLYLTTEDQGHIKLFHLPLTSTNSNPSTPTAIITKHSLNAVHWANDSLLITQSSLVTPSFISLYTPHKSSKKSSQTALYFPSIPRSHHRFHQPRSKNSGFRDSMPIPSMDSCICPRTLIGRGGIQWRF